MKSRFLKRENLHYWGLSDYTRLNELHNEFLNLDKKLSVSAMDFETISDQLIRLGVVETMRSANITAMYAVQWMCGQTFDFSKSQVKIHSSRLIKIGIDIALRFNLSKFCPVAIREIRKVVVADCPIPDWYQMPQIFKLAS
ncbi:phage/plasmid replication domain-containing protein [Gilliamella sp. wkB171]|uniref:phage/plasmid replication domain-containing protein n=1 Tax=Gilliamella sp. wkB171 TaxID=3120258 RepID=UPI001C5422DF|nr:phage/plasmid replication protein [Gilliamella apicola]